MSKPSPGSVAHPKPRQGPAISKIRLPPRIQTRPPRIHQELPKAGVDPEAQRAAEAANTRTLWETIIRRKKLVSAIAFGVVVVAGSILGARLKETWQEYGKRQELEEAARRLAESTAAAGVTASAKTLESTALQNNPSEPIGVTQAITQQVPAYSVDIARQITLLEDRRAMLNRQKTNLEQKIQRLRERKVRKQEMEARRPQPVQINK